MSHVDIWGTCSRPEKQPDRGPVAKEGMKELVLQEQQKQVVGNSVREITEDLLMHGLV